MGDPQKQAVREYLQQLFETQGINGVNLDEVIDSFQQFLQRTVQRIGSKTLPNVNSLRLPAMASRVSTVLNRRQNLSGLMVFVIYDQYTNYEGQSNIKKLLDWMALDYKLRLVCVEGASGDVDVKSLHQVSNRQSVKGLAEELLRKGEIRGAEYWAMLSEQSVALYGIDDTALHEQQSSAFKAQNEGYEKHRWAFDALNKSADALKNAYLSSIWMNLFKRFGSLVSGFTGSDSVSSIKTICQSFTFYEEDGLISLDDYPTISAFLTALELENFDAKKAESQRDQLLPEIARIFTETEIPAERFMRLLAAKYKEDNKPVEDVYQLKPEQYIEPYQRLVNSIVEEIGSQKILMQWGQVNEIDYYDYIIDISSLLDINLGKYPDFIQYVHYLHHSEKFNGEILQTEILSAMQTIKSSLPASPTETNVIELYEMLIGMQLFCKLQLSPNDYDRLVEKYGKPNFGKLLTDNLLRENLSGSTMDQLMGVEKEISQLVDAARQFYRLARTRAANLAQNTLEQMRSRGEIVTAITIGGFLGAPIQAELNRNDVSFIVLVPSIDVKTTPQDESTYTKRILEQVPPTKLLHPDHKLNRSSSTASLNAVEAPNYEPLAVDSTSNILPIVPLPLNRFPTLMDIVPRINLDPLNDLKEQLGKDVYQKLIDKFTKVVVKSMWEAAIKNNTTEQFIAMVPNLLAPLPNHLFEPPPMLLKGGKSSNSYQSGINDPSLDPFPAILHKQALPSTSSVALNLIDEFASKNEFFRSMVSQKGSESFWKESVQNNGNDEEKALELLRQLIALIQEKEVDLTSQASSSPQVDAKDCLITLVGIFVIILLIGLGIWGLINWIF